MARKLLIIKHLTYDLILSSGHSLAPSKLYVDGSTVVVVHSSGGIS
jgi:hypothetical protein